MSKVQDIMIEKFLQDVEEMEEMPWQRPYERYNSFNYFTQRLYTGINRIILPFGEYVTLNQMCEYNKTLDDPYLMQKGIKWRYVLFGKTQNTKMSNSDVLNLFGELPTSDGFFGTDNKGNHYFMQDGQCYKQYKVFMYHKVADRTFFKNSKGECLPSRVESGEVVLVKSEAKNIFDNYVSSEGIDVVDTINSPSYNVKLDRISVNKHHKDEDSFWCSCFHEMGHSTGILTRLNRDVLIKTDEESYAIEECIAEITASLLCAECGISSFHSAASDVYKDSIAYVQYWKKMIKEWGSKFFYVTSQADKAFNYIMSKTYSDGEVDY